MTAKEYLRQLQDMEKAIAKRQDRRQEILYRAKYVTANYSGVKVRSGSTSDRVADAVIAAETLQQEIDADIWNLVCKRHEVINLIQRLEEVSYIEMLFRRYILYKQLKDIAKETGYTRQYVRELHGKALSEFEAQHTNILQEAS